MRKAFIRSTERGTMVYFFFFFMSTKQVNNAMHNSSSSSNCAMARVCYGWRTLYSSWRARTHELTSVCRLVDMADRETDGSKFDLLSLPSHVVISITIVSFRRWLIYKLLCLFPVQLRRCRAHCRASLQLFKGAWGYMFWGGIQRAWKIVVLNWLTRN